MSGKITNTGKNSVNTSRVSNKLPNSERFCGVCKKAGKSEEEYTSHFTKSAPGPKGVTTCPLILASVCKCCFKQGHFADHCPKRAEIDHIQNKCKTINIRIQTNKPNSIRYEALSSENRFHVLRDLEDDVDPVIVVSSTPAKKTFASVLACPPCAPVKKTQSCPAYIVPVKMDRLPKMNQTRKSWADTTDSDSEEE